MKDRNSRHIINNQANIELIGAKTEEETIGKTVMDYFDEETAVKQIETDREIMESGKAVNNLEESIINKMGEKRWLLTAKCRSKRRMTK